MNNPIVLVVTVLVFLFFCFTTYMSTKTWRWHHVTMAFFVFCAALVFCYYASLSLKTRVALMREYDKQAKEWEKVQQEQLLIKHGNLKEIEQSEDSLRSIRHKVEREMLERGRVWRNCTPVGVQPDGTIVLNVNPGPAPAPAPAVDPAAAAPLDPAAALAAAAPAPAAPAAPAFRLDPKTVLFGFLETPQPQATPPGVYPTVYLGEFAVTDSTDTTVTVRPLLAVPPQQIPQGTWSLYETMPIDSHTLFAAGIPDDNHLFGKPDEEKLRALIPKLPDQSDEEYAALIRQYMRDGTAATEDDPPEDVWFQVKFLKPHEVQVDAEAAVSALDNRFFDATGRAVVSRLQRGEPAKFKPNDFAVFTQVYANDLINQGIVEKIKAIYVRPLHDFEFAFHEINDRMNRLAADIDRVQRTTAKLATANSLGLEQIAYRQQELTKLQADLVGFQKEAAAAAGLKSAVEAKWTERRKAIQDFYKANRALSEELRELSEKMRQQINEQTDSVARAAS